ncbi:DUF1285 domain-containing protein [Altererythrobacter xixiisoli]|uniref:DUF1285 domain-containing protein n=1 Tax=Croceibacterium xixiisoli TaxID=1476466 RepID=A0A6I4TXM3_9SPHN|nr:DUF1285 domain-containing protein [Croceibacterium xixiisoli]MXO99388.1 DUF1285 domain-containing protein [Croceibacterium xixiisoli]
MPYEPLPDLSAMSLAQIAAAVKARRLPPIESWHPEETMDSGMRIAADGTWFHNGSPIYRLAMVRAFSTLLMRDDDGQHWLVTPQCRQSVEVEDAAFIAVEMQARHGALAFRLNTDELIVAGPDHRLRATGNPEVPAIYLGVRHGCEARLNRSTWLQIANHALAGSNGMNVVSRGISFPLVP